MDDSKNSEAESLFSNFEPFQLLTNSYSHCDEEWQEPIR